MANELKARSDFTETLAVHMALRSALKSRQFEKNAAVRKAATALCQDLEGESSIYGRQLKMLNLMGRGATLVDLGRKLHCSRRTVFRYLNHLEDAGVPIELDGTKYTVGKSVTKMLRV